MQRIRLFYYFGLKHDLDTFLRFTLNLCVYKFSCIVWFHFKCHILMFDKTMPPNHRWDACQKHSELHAALSTNETAGINTTLPVFGTPYAFLTDFNWSAVFFNVIKMQEIWVVNSRFLHENCDLTVISASWTAETRIFKDICCLECLEETSHYTMSIGHFDPEFVFTLREKDNYWFVM